LMRIASFGTVLLVAVAAGGCNSVTISDDVDLTLDFHLFTGPGDQIHAPYVAGATMTVWAQSTKEKEDTSGWTVESSDPSVFMVMGAGTHGKNDVSVKCAAAAPG